MTWVWWILIYCVASRVLLTALVVASNLRAIGKLYPAGPEENKRAVSAGMMLTFLLPLLGDVVLVLVLGGLLGQFVHGLTRRNLKPPEVPDGH